MAIIFGEVLGLPVKVMPAISWKMTEAKFALYLLPVSGPVILLEVDVGSVPGRR